MKLVVPVVVVLLGLVFVVFLSLPDNEEGTPAVYTPRKSPDMERVRSLDPATPEGLKGLKELMLSSDKNVATQAGQKLSIQYPEGLLALAAQAPQLSAEVRSELFGRRITPVTLELAALAVKTGSEQERAGGYLILESKPRDAKSRASRMGAVREWELQEVFDALDSRIPFADQEELAAIEKQMERYHPEDPAKNASLLGHKSPLVRARAVNRLGALGYYQEIDAVRALASDPDPRVRAEVKVALELMVKAAKANAGTP
jgi:hypothetical protein